MGMSVKPLTDVASKCSFCMRFAHYRASRWGFTSDLITVAYTVLAMVHLRWFTCDDLLAMATRNYHHFMLFELSSKRLYYSEINAENV